MPRSENPFKAKRGWKQLRGKLGIGIFGVAAYFILFCAVLIFGQIAYKGAPTFVKGEAPFINTEFFTSNPEILRVWHDAEGNKFSMPDKEFDIWREQNPAAQIIAPHALNYSAGGIAGPLVGTALLVFFCMIIALFIGISAAIYLSEYCGRGRVMSIIRLSILNLAGVPSIVFALFGWGIFCHAAPVLVDSVDDRSLLSFAIGSSYLSFQGWGTSLIAGSCTLAIMVLPVIITACEESLRAVPNGFREASFALGSSQWQTIRKAVLPYALPGILTATVLGITRVAGETAPIMLTATSTDKTDMPMQALQDEGLWAFLTQSVQALPFHIYTLAKLPDDPLSKPMQHGATFAFLLLVMGFAFISILLRNRVRKKLKW